MPQLMPLMWVISVFMFLYIFMMLINLFSYKSEYLLSDLFDSEESNSVKMMW